MAKIYGVRVVAQRRFRRLRTRSRRKFAALPNDAPYAEWGRWFLADRATRSIAPGFTLTPAEAEKLAASLAPPPAAAPATAPRP